ncbi:MAG: hypothetical protein KGY54_14725 [Oleiphilaceae bacterium]|nr:hypothetical protein [Oleiphilaceae bacterium]
MSHHFSMGISRIAQRTVQDVLNSMGLELRRKPQKIATPTPPPLYDDPLEALYRVRGEQKAAFLCPIRQIVVLKGFGFGKERWHPLSDAIRGYNEHGYDYAENLLANFYGAHQPLDASKAIPGFEYAPDILKTLRPHLYHLSPWTALSPDEIDSAVRSWTRKDNAEHGRNDLSFDSHGFVLHGPVHEDKRRLELNRLLALRASIAQNGFNRTFGDVNVRVLKRKNEFLFIANGGGHHRTAIMAALGYDFIPAQFFPGPIVNDVADVELWPQVRFGNWSADQASAYVDHLFDFDSVAWARQQQLVNSTKRL